MATKKKKAPPTLATFSMSILWTCTSCGFVLEGRQPHMECPSCEAYKTSYVNLPQHIEADLRANLKKGQHFNATEVRQERLRVMREANAQDTFYVKGRFMP